MLFATANVAGLTMEIVPVPRFTTQTRPSGATATLRGDVPTVISRTRVSVAPSNTATESLSGLTTQTRVAPLACGSSAIADDVRAEPGAMGPRTACTNVFVTLRPSASRSVNVTRYTPGSANVCVADGVAEAPSGKLPSPKSQLYSAPVTEMAGG